MNNKNKKYWIGVYSIAFIGLITLHYLFNLKLFQPIERFIPFLKGFSITLGIMALILLIRNFLVFLIDKLDTARGNRYNLKRVTRLIANILLIVFALSSVF